MNLRKRRLRESRIYVILNEEQFEKTSLRGLADKIRAFNADIIQLRIKDSPVERIYAYAKFLRQLLLKTGTLFIINDYIDIAKIVDSDGVHLGQGDLEIRIARRILGRDKIIGISTHSLAQAKAAQSAGADYIGIGPVFRTPTKPQYPPIGLGVIRKVKRQIRIPFFAIGGINQETIGQVTAAGAKRVAVARAVNEVAKIKKALRKA